MVLRISTRFCDNVFNGLKVMESTKIPYGNMSGSITLLKMRNRVTVVVTAPLYLYQVQESIFNCFLSYEADRNPTRNIYKGA